MLLVASSKHLLPLISFALLLPLARAEAVNAMASGNWDSDIWALKREIEPGLRPLANDQVLIFENSAVVVNSRVLESGSFTGVQLGGSNSALTLESGAALATEILNISGADSSATVKNGADLAVGEKGLRVSNGATGTMRVEGGTVSVTGEHFFIAGAPAALGLLEVSGGTMTHSGTSLVIASNKGTNGTLRVNGGHFTARRIIFTQNHRSALGTVELSSGSLKADAFDSGLNQANALLQWTGGTLDLGESNQDITNTGTGEFAIGGVGAVGSFLVSESTAISYTQGPNASLAFDIASDENFDRFALGSDASCTVTLSGKLNLNFLEGYNPPAGTTFDLITATSIEAKGLTLGGNAASRFTFKIEKTGGNEVLRLTAIP